MLDAREALLTGDLVCPHTDADGLAAGALAVRARGEDASAAVLLGRAQTPWGPAPDLPEGASVAVLEECRRTWRAAYDRVVRTAPRFFGDVAVLRFDVPGRVQFSVRGGGLAPDEFERMPAGLA